MSDQPPAQPGTRPGPSAAPSPGAAVSVDVWPLPGRGAFGDDRAAHRGWYRANIVALVSRADLNNERIAAAAEVSGRTITDWFVDATGMKPQAYRALHGLAKHTATRRSPDPQALASLDRLVGPLACWDGIEAEVVVDLRAGDRLARLPTARVLGREPNLSQKQWRRTVVAHPPTPARPATTGGATGGAEAGPAWVLHGYGLGTNKDHAVSVLLATHTGDPTGAQIGGDGETWRMAFLTDGRAHGKFALSWAKEVLPQIAETLVMAGGVKPETQWRHVDAQAVAYRSLEMLADALEDPAAWVGDATTPVAGWDTTGVWSRSVGNLERLLTWAAAGVSRRDLIPVFEQQRWGPEHAHVLAHYLGVDDFESMGQMLHAKGYRVDINHVAWMLQEWTAGRR